MDVTTLKNDLEEDIRFRKDNLTTIRTMPLRYFFREEDVAAWTRCAFPIIYAEWEGFFVHAIELYISKINSLCLSLDDLHPNYWVINTEKRFKQFKEYPQKLTQKYKFLNDLIVYFRNTSSVSLERYVNTESNLGFDVLNNILSVFNLTTIKDHIDDTEYSLSKAIKHFLDKRNGIAHGDPSSTTSQEDIREAIKLVERLMNLTKDSIVEGYKNECFKKSES